MEKNPHFNIDINIDEAKLNKDENAPTITPILGRIHSIQSDAKSLDNITLLETSVFIIGFHVGKGGPTDIHRFLQDLIREFSHLSPSNENIADINERCCTASLHRVIADGPMRFFLKRTKGLITRNSSFFKPYNCGDPVTLDSDAVQAPIPPALQIPHHQPPPEADNVPEDERDAQQPQHTTETRQLRQTTSLRSHPMKKKMKRRTFGRRSVVDRGHDDARILFTMREREYRARNKTTTNVFNQMYSLKPVSERVLH